MSIMESRRDFLKKSTMLVGTAAVLGSSAILTGCAKSETDAEIPAHPYKYVELDPDQAEKDGYKYYWEGGCSFGVANALLLQLKEKVGAPFTSIPAEMFTVGRGGFSCGTLCGTLDGATHVIGMVCNPDDAKAIMKELFKWYTSTKLPMYQPEVALPAQSVAPSVNCVDSLSTFQIAANITPEDKLNKNRCGGLTGDVARKTVELLNIHFGFAAAPVTPDDSEKEPELAANEYIGEAVGFNKDEKIKVKVTMDGDKISKIDVLSHGETAGVSDPAFSTIPDAIIKAQSTKVDVAAGATYSSNGIMAAVEDALSKVGK